MALSSSSDGMTAEMAEYLAYLEFRKQILAQISQLEAKKEEYVVLRAELKDICTKIGELQTNTNIVHDYINEGIKEAITNSEFETKFTNFNNTTGQAYNTLIECTREIDSIVADLDQQIQALRSQL